MCGEDISPAAVIKAPKWQPTHKSQRSKPSSLSLTNEHVCVHLPGVDHVGIWGGAGAGRSGGMRWHRERAALIRRRLPPPAQPSSLTANQQRRVVSSGGEVRETHCILRVGLNGNDGLVGRVDVGLQARDGRPGDRKGSGTRVRLAAWQCKLPPPIASMPQPPPHRRLEQPASGVG